MIDEKKKVQYMKVNEGTIEPEGWLQILLFWKIRFAKKNYTEGGGVCFRCNVITQQTLLAPFRFHRCLNTFF